MLRRVRAADSIALGSLRRRVTSLAIAALVLRRCSTSALIRSNCCDAEFISARVRIVTETHIANVARMIVVNTTHDGTMPPRRRMSVRVPSSSSESSRAGAKVGIARVATRCVRSRLSTQYVLAALFKEHLQVFNKFHAGAGGHRPITIQTQKHGPLGSGEPHAGHSHDVCCCQLMTIY